MHAISFLLSALLALGTTAAPTTSDTSITTASTTPMAFDLPAAPQLAARDVTGLMRLCTDFDLGGICADVTIPSGAITTTPLAQGFSAFEINSGQLCNLLGGCPSSAQILTPGLNCNLSDSVSVFTGCGLIAGTGHQVIVDSLDGSINFNGPLNDNLRCIQCQLVGN